jgi:ubiquinone biosynthesis protein COQ9
MQNEKLKIKEKALAIMARPSNVSMSLKHLGDIADDIWYFAGDRSPDVRC